MNLTMASSHKMSSLFVKSVFELRCLNCRYLSIQTSEEIRNKFLDFFIHKNLHKFVRSSPVVPFCDPTVAFVNAGMNQFKGVFLGQFSPPHPRVANHQKCVRVGGKHNDLDIVGTDGYHHTFFEMLGNWSFGDYYKFEACEMAWSLLTGPYAIDPKRLVITYFGGDKDLGLEPDYECRDIWRKIGVPDACLISGSLKDNFWEMGAMGPCGPCSELHYRCDDNSLMEIWNIVFIQFNRQSDGKIISLPKCHIDTGMGLERMAALLQNKSSNYDTDLFSPLIQTIHERSNGLPPYSGKFGPAATLDTAYRTLADHSRMISICLADGVFPCRNLRLKNVLRKAISLSNHTFKNKSGMLSALYDKVSENLGCAYPELLLKMNDAKKIIIHEEQSLAALENSVAKQRNELLQKYPETVHLSSELSPGLAEGYKQFKQIMRDTAKNETIPGSVAFKLYDTFGIDEQMIMKIAYINNLTVDTASFKEHLNDHRMKHKAVFTETANSKINMALNSKIDALFDTGIKPTVDKYKYNYICSEDEKYTFPPLMSTLLAILNKHGEVVDSIDVNSQAEYHLILDKTNFYCEEGGQARDIGQITLENGAIFNVLSVTKVRDLVLHTGKFITSDNSTNESTSSNNDIKLGDNVEVKINKQNRINIMKHHTATHLLNAAIKRVLPGSVTCQLGSKVTASGLTLDLAVYGDKLSPKAITDAQELVRLACSKAAPIQTYIIDSQQLLSAGEVTTVPGELYPEEGLRLVEIDFLGSENTFSRELCCGTHVTSSRFIGDFCITGVRGAGGHAPTIRALAGDLATQVYQLNNKALNLKNEIEYNEIADHKELQDKIKALKNELNELCKGEGAPYGVRAECLDTLASIEKRMKDKDTKALIELVQAEMATVVSEAEAAHRPFLVHFLVCSYLLEPSSLSLTTAAQCGAGKPVLVLACAGGMIKATCHVPMSYVNSNFTAEKWMGSIIPTFGTYIIEPLKNQNLQTIAHMKGKKVSLINCESLVADAILKATTYAQNFLQVDMDNTNNGQSDSQWQEEQIKQKSDHGS